MTIVIKKIIFSLIIGLFFWRPVFASLRPNNKFGIHLSQSSNDEIRAAAKLVNSSGGDWGYVTLVIRENDRSQSKWQAVFDNLRRYHLIPIVRLATRAQGAVWRRPTEDDAQGWVKFLNSLNWVVKNRYVVLFNEPNQGAEWGGKVDPKSYGQVSYRFAKELKKANQDFFVMLAGLDAAAPTRMPHFQDERLFLQAIFKEIKPNQWQSLIDGWASHSYPRNFVGRPLARGRNTPRTYQWEKNLLYRLGFRKRLPVFITETGWLNSKTSARNFYLAFKKVWLPDRSVQAVTPFILDYQGAPFTRFSWRRLNSDGFYPQYNKVREMDKVIGQPEIIDKGKIKAILPTELVISSNYHYQITIVNEGEAIWDKKGDYFLQLDSPLKYFFSDIYQINPGEERDIDFYFQTPTKINRRLIKIQLIKKNKPFLQTDWPLKILPMPDLKIKLTAFPQLRTNLNNVEIQFFDENQQLVYQRKGIRIRNGWGKISHVPNVALAENYRVVVLVHPYLPRQTHWRFQAGENKISFPWLIPLDFNGDGKFSWQDLISLIRVASCLGCVPK